MSWRWLCICCTAACYEMGSVDRQAAPRRRRRVAVSERRREEKTRCGPELNHRIAFWPFSRPACLREARLPLGLRPVGWVGVGLGPLRFGPGGSHNRSRFRAGPADKITYLSGCRNPRQHGLITFLMITNHTRKLYLPRETCVYAIAKN